MPYIFEDESIKESPQRFVFEDDKKPEENIISPVFPTVGEGYDPFESTMRLAEIRRKASEEARARTESMAKEPTGLWDIKPGEKGTPVFKAKVPVLGEVTEQSLIPFLRTAKKVAGVEPFGEDPMKEVMEPASEAAELYLGGKVIGGIVKGAKWLWMKRLPEGKVRPLPRELKTLPAPSDVVEGEIVPERPGGLPPQKNIKSLPPGTGRNEPEVYIQTESGYAPAFWDEKLGSYYSPIPSTTQKQPGYQGFQLREPPAGKPIIRSETRGEGFVIKPPGGIQEKLGLWGRPKVEQPVTSLTESQKLLAPIVTSEGKTVGIQPKTQEIPDEIVPKRFVFEDEQEPKELLAKPEAKVEEVKKPVPELSPTAKSQFKLPGMKQGIEFGGKEGIPPTLEGTPLMKTAIVEQKKKVQPELFGEKQKPDLIGWIKGKGGINLKDVNADMKGLQTKESGYVGLLTKKGRGLDELAQEWEWETGEKITTDELSERLIDRVMAGKKGPEITESYIRKAEAEHYKELEDFFGEMGKEKTVISTKPSMPKKSITPQKVDLDSDDYGLLEGKKKSALDFMGILKSEKGEMGMPKEVFESLEKVKKSGKELAMGAYKEVGSPYRVFEFDKTGNGTKLWNLTDNADRQGAIFHKKFIEATQKNVKIAPDTEASQRIGDLLDNYESWEHIPKWEQDKLNPEEARAFQYMREGWNKMADVLMEKGLLTPTRRIKSYMFRIFPKDEIYKAWRDELEALTTVRAEAGPEFKQSADFKARYEKLQKVITEYEKTGTILYDYIPKSLTAPFLKERTGAKGYSFDAVNAWTTYEYYYKRKLFDEPAVKESLKLMQQMEPKFKGYTRQYLRRFLGMEKPDELKRAEMVLTNLEWLKDLGFSSRSAVVNFTQSSMTIAEIGPKWTAEGAYFSFTPEGKAIFETSGHKADVPNLRWGTEAKNIPDSVKRSAGYLFDKVELANRMVSYLGGYKKALSEGKTPEEAAKYGDEVVRKTQGIYGRTGSPIGQMRRGGSVGLQFITTPIKMGETFVDWALHSKMKLLAYLGLVTATSETLKELGVDMSNVLGIGIDNRELLKGMVHLFKGESSSALRHTKMGLPFIPFINPKGTQGSGIFPSGFFPAIETMQDILKLEWEKWIPLQAKRMVEAGKALAEGEYKVPVTGEKGYPIRNIRTGELKTTLSLPQLASRTFLAQPRKESEQWKALKEESMIEEDKKDKLRSIGKAIIEKNKEKINKLLKSEGVVSNEEVNQAVLSEWKKRNLTPLARKELQLWMSKNGLPYRITVGESYKLEP